MARSHAVTQRTRCLDAEEESLGITLVPDVDDRLCKVAVVLFYLL